MGPKGYNKAAIIPYQWRSINYFSCTRKHAAAEVLPLKIPNMGTNDRLVPQVLPRNVVKNLPKMSLKNKSINKSNDYISR